MTRSTGDGAWPEEAGEFEPDEGSASIEGRNPVLLHFSVAKVHSLEDLQCAK